jgi:branched-chain amino acid transport system substrate-binding protein
MKGKVKFLAAILSFIIAMTSLAGCGQSGEGTSSKIIKVASVTPLSGSQAALGEAIKLGAQLAVEDYKPKFDKAGFQLEFSPQDDQADPKVGVSVAQSMLSDKDILGVCGHFNSGVAIPASEIYAKDNLCMVSPSNTATQVTDRKLPDVNRICARDDAQGPVGADFAVKDLGAKKIFIIQDKTTYGQGVADEFKKQALKDAAQIVGYEGITQGESDFSAVLNEVASKNPDLVYFGGTYPEGSLILKQMRAKGISAKFMGPDGMDSSEVIKIAGNAATGAYYTSVAADPLLTDKGKEWVDRYEKKFGKKPESYSVYGYDAMSVLLDGILKASQDNGNKKPTREQVSKSVRSTQNFHGIITNVSFDDKGDNKDAMVYIYEFKTPSYPGVLVKGMPVKQYLK